MTKYIVKHNGQIVDTRKSDRAYTHAVVVRHSHAAAVAAVEQIGADPIERKNYNYNTRFAGLTREECIAKIHRDCPGWQVEYELRDLDKDMSSCAAYQAQHPTYEAWVAAAKAERRDQIARDLAQGYYSKFFAAGYCGRLDLAQKAAAQERARSWLEEVHIVPVEIEQPKAKRAA